MKRRNKIFAICICLMLVTTTVIIVIAEKPKKGKEYFELPPTEQPYVPSEGWIIFCDQSDGNLKALDDSGELHVLCEKEPIPPPEDYNVGLYWQSGGVSSNEIARWFDGCIINMTYDGNNYKIGNTGWIELEKIGDTSVNYYHSSGIYFSGDSNTGALYKGIHEDKIPDSDNYTLEMVVEFVSGWGNLGLVYNYLDEGNYSIVYLIWNRDEFKYLRGHQIENGVVDVWTINYPTAPGTFILKVEVDNIENIYKIYVNDVLQYTV